MIKKHAVIKFLALGAALSVAGCGKTETARYKLTVEVYTPQGIKRGYAVRELIRRTPSGTFLSVGQDRGSTKLRGEAVAVDLPGGKTVFALLTGADGDVDYPTQILYRSGLWGRPIGSAVELWPTAPETSGLKNTNPLPMLITFGDLKDPKSVERVEPDDLAASFGPGMTLKRVIVAVTSDAVTVGIEKRLGWLKSYYNRQLDGHRYNDSQNFSNSLNVLSLQQGTEQ